MADGVTLKKYFEEKFRSLVKSTDKGFVDAQEAVNRAYESNNKRLDQMNEFRAQSKDREDTFATKVSIEALRTEVMSLINRNTEDIKASQLVQANLAGKASQSSVSVALIISVIGIIIGIIGIILKFI